MRHVSYRASAGFIVLIACAPQAEQLRADVGSDTATVAFAIDLWPGEGIPVIEMRRDVLALHAEPDLEQRWSIRYVVVLDSV